MNPAIHATDHRQNTDAVKELTLFPAAGPSALPLRVGEILRAAVVEPTAGGRALLRIHGTPLEAKSPLSLRAGDELLVRVERLSPEVVLRLQRGGPSDHERLARALLLHRARPGDLKELLDGLRELCRGDHRLSLSRWMTREELQALRHLQARLVVTRESLREPLFLRSFMIGLGMADERRLIRALFKGGAVRRGRDGESLKGLLQLLAGRLTAAGLRKAAGGTEGSEAGPLADFVDRALRTIEVKQLVNVLAQELDGLLLLRLPWQLPGRIALQELYIGRERSTSATGRETDHRIVLFLELDSLGAVAVDASVGGGRLSCTFRAADRRPSEFIRSILGELACGVAARCGLSAHLQSVQQPDLGRWKQNFLKRYRLCRQNTIDLDA